MAIKSWNKILGLLVVLQVLLAKAADVAVSAQTLNVSSTIDDYVTATQRKYSDGLGDMSTTLVAFRSEYQTRLDTISYNRDLIEAQLVDNDQKLYALGVLNDQRKYCVQKYYSQLVTVATVRASYTNCVTDASNAITTILSAPTATYNGLNSWFVQTFPTAIANCQRTFSTAYQNQTICVANYIQTSNTLFSTNQRTFNTQLDASQCAANSRVRLATECVFTASNNALASIGTVSRLVDDCINGVSLCPPCTAVATPQCENTVTVVQNSVTFTNETLGNPFKGLSSTSTCALVNFKK